VGLTKAEVNALLRAAGNSTMSISTVYEKIGEASVRDALATAVNSSGSKRSAINAYNTLE